MDNTALLFLTESVLGKGQSTSKGNYAFKCPFCTHHKNKLEINLRTTAKRENFWHCWICGAKGKSLLTLFKKIKASQDKINELNILIIPDKAGKNIEIGVLELPKEFIALTNHETLITDRVAQIESKHALRFLRSRGITVEDIIKYNIGFCKEGKYGHRIIIPSYDNNRKLNYFIARDYKGETPQKYKNPPVAAKDVIGFELYINWDAPIILVEGMFDALTIKRNVIPLFGKVIHGKLMEKLVKSSVDRIYIALDQDARRDALKQAEMLMSYGKEIYLVEMEGKDANEIGFENFLNTIEQTQPLNFQSLLEKKLQLL
jgi:DNA primase